MTFFDVRNLTSTELLRLGDEFQLPFSGGCELPKPLQIPLPPEMLMMSFVATMKNDYSAATKEWFDIKNQLSRCDQLKASTPSIIQDHKHGIKYTMGDTCNSSADVFPIVCHGERAMAALMMGPKYFIGETMVRGIPADVWEAKSHGDEQVVGDAVRVYYSKPNVGLSINTVSANQIPLRVDIMYLSSTDVFDLHDFYATDDETEFNKHFNIDTCQLDYQYIELVLYPTNEIDLDLFVLSNAISNLTTATRTHLLQATKISPLRIPYLKLDLQEDPSQPHVIATAKILEAPDYLTSFSMEDDSISRPATGELVKQVGLEECAKRCIGYDDCTSIVRCDNDCYLMPSEWRNPRHGGDECSVYDRVENEEPFIYKSLSEIVTDLNVRVPKDPSLFRTTIYWTDTKSTVFEARGFHSHIVQFDDRASNGPYHLELSGESIRPDHPASLVFDEIATVSECYRECVSVSNISCNSFSFCADAQKARCVLSSVPIVETAEPSEEQENAEKLDTARCSIYSINYLRHFEHLPGRYVRVDSGVELEAESPNDCARFCRHEKINEKDCRSFDFCKDKCLFHNTHYVVDEGGKETLKNHPDCDHYALNFASDYSSVGKYRLKGEDTKVESLSADECAQRCSLYSDNTCNSYAYCSDPVTDQSTCYLYGKSNKGREPAERTSQSCTLFMKHADVNEVINPNRQDKQQTVSVGMSTGAMVGLLIAMTVIGSAIGLVVFIKRDALRNLIPRRKPWGQTVSYNRQHNLINT